MEASTYHDEANDWLRSRGWVSRRSDETWRECYADDWRWLGMPDGYEPTLIIFTGECFQTHYGYTTEEVLRKQTYSDNFSDLEELKQHIEMIESWPSQI